MSALDQIINISISQQTASVPQAGFGIPLIIGTSNRMGSDLIRYYTSTAAMLADGFLTSDPEYIHAVEVMSQALTPTQFGVGAVTASVIQVDTMTPTAVNNHVYTLTIAGVPYVYTADSSATISEIVAGLLALINADAGCPATATGTVTLILTAKNTGVGFVTSVNADVNMALVHTTANHSQSTDVAAISAVSDLWYGLIATSKVAGDQMDLAAYIETVKKIYVTATNDVNAPTASTTDIASVLKGKSYKRTALIFSTAATGFGGSAPSAGPDAAWMGGMLPTVPGSATWKFKTLVGISPSVYSGTQRTFLIGTSTVPGKNCNIYETVGGVPITEEGYAVGGQFMDITVGVDWLQATMETNIYSLLIQNQKIPYTDQGASIIENAIRQTIKQGVDNGLIDGASPITVTVPKVLSIPTNTRAQRILTPVTFSCRLAGAFHFIVINGTVTV